MASRMNLALLSAFENKVLLAHSILTVNKYAHCSHIVYGRFLTMSELSSYKGNHMAGEIKYLLFGLL